MFVCKRIISSYFLKTALLLIFLTFSLNSWAQLPDFTVNATVEGETCAGNGSVTFTVTGIADGATVQYAIYSQPSNTIVYSGDNPTFSGLAAGDYTAIITEELNGESNVQNLSFTVEDLTGIPLTYEMLTQAQNCGNGNTLIVEVTSGSASLYEIISGPVTAPPQESNTFTGLVDGQYVIRVYDDCGQGIVTTYTAIFEAAPPQVSPPLFDDVVTQACDTVTLSNSLTYPEGTIISYPITVTYTVTPSDGSDPLIFTQTYETGAPTEVTFENTFPYEEGVTYTYDIQITNTCGNSYGLTGQTFSPVPQLSMDDEETDCGQFFINAAISGVHLPYTINFSSVPDDFNPADFNAGYPGPFNDTSIQFGDEAQSVPEGTYVATVTDACNRTSEPFTLVIENRDPDPSAVGHNNGCFSDFGFIRISVPDRQVVTAVITAAPDAYTEALPQDVSANINSAGVLVLNNMPKGDYVITITDSCGATYTDIEVNIPDYVAQGLTATPLADCTIGIGAATLSSGNGDLVSVTLTSAPSGYENALPQDVSAYIDSESGDLFMDNLPAGNYAFTATDACGITNSATVTVTGYVPYTGNPYNFIPLCNSFDVEMSDNETSSLNPTYWLQKQNPDNPDEWGHPDTLVPYTEGTLPNSSNSVQLQNGVTNYNFHFFGIFRIVKAFESVGNTQAVKICSSQLGDTFEYYYDVYIDNIYNLDCLSNPNNVYIEATGLEPLHYYALDANNNVVVDNGNNNIFSGLVPGVYQFMVENSCGASVRLTRDISLLPDLVDAGNASDLPVCVEPGEPMFQEFDLTLQDAQILNGSSPELYAITYYTNQSDADNGVNAITNPESFVNISNPQQIFVRMEHVYITVCPEIASFYIEVGLRPDLDVAEEQYLCVDEGFLVLDAGLGFDTYTWLPTGETTQTITVTAPGNYTVTASNSNSITSCPASATITVLPVPVPEITSIDTFDWTENQNGFTVDMSDDPTKYLYSIDAVNFQESNTFSGLPPGIYTVFVIDRNGCGIVDQKLDLLNYPKFFTPNGDSYNEYWHIPFSWFEPKFMVYIYDRYGKLITSLDANDQGWDGTLNGNRLPATDYWFVVKRQDGRIHKGHFSLLR